MQDSGTKYCGSVETSVVYKQICLFSAWKKNHVNYFFSLKKIKNYLMSLFNIVYVVGKIVKWQKRQVKYSYKCYNYAHLKFTSLPLKKSCYKVMKRNIFSKLNKGFCFLKRTFFFWIKTMFYI